MDEYEPLKQRQRHGIPGEHIGMHLVKGRNRLALQLYPLEIAPPPQTNSVIVSTPGAGQLWPSIDPGDARPPPSAGREALVTREPHYSLDVE